MHIPIRQAIILAFCFHGYCEASGTSTHVGRTSRFLSSIKDRLWGSRSQDEVALPQEKVESSKETDVGRPKRNFGDVEGIEEEFEMLQDTNPLADIYEMNDFRNERINSYFIKLHLFVAELEGIKYSAEKAQIVLSLIKVMKARFAETVESNQESFMAYYDISKDSVLMVNQSNITILCTVYKRLDELATRLIGIIREKVVSEETSEDDENEADDESSSESEEENQVEVIDEVQDVKLSEEEKPVFPPLDVFSLGEDKKDEESEDPEYPEYPDFSATYNESSEQEETEPAPQTGEEKEDDGIQMIESRISDDERKEAALAQKKEAEEKVRPVPKIKIEIPTEKVVVEEPVKKQLPLKEITKAAQVPSLFDKEYHKQCEFAYYNENAINDYYNVRLNRMKNSSEKAKLESKRLADIKLYKESNRTRGKVLMKQSDAKKKTLARKTITRPKN